MSKKKQEYRKVRLLKPHTHGGVRYEVGEEIELKKEQAEWLIDSYVAERKTQRKAVQALKEKLDRFSKTLDEVKND